jgi:hypothetical protein
MNVFTTGVAALRGVRLPVRDWQVLLVGLSGAMVGTMSLLSRWLRDIDECDYAHKSLNATQRRERARDTGDQNDATPEIPNLISSTDE